MTHPARLVSAQALSPSRRLRVLPWLLALSGCCTWAHAQSLVELYQAARGFDASYQSAQAQYQASVAKAAQARAGVLPTVNLSAGANRTSQEALPASERAFGSQTATLSASQPLYRPANVASYSQGEKQIDQAQAQLQLAEQDLIVRVSQAYFDVLAAQDSLAFVQRQKEAVAEQLASAKRNFEVGTATITDTREAQARFDLVVAQELAADNDVRIKTVALTQLVGLPQASPQPLNSPALPALEPSDVEQWVNTAEQSHPGIRQQAAALEVAKLETEKAQAGNRPTVDLTGSYSAINNNGTTTSTNDARVNQATVGVSLNWPLFAGFSIQNRVKETLALEDKARSDLDATKRTVLQSTRTAYFGVQSGMAQVKALQAAEASSQSALDANKLGYQVGVRINIDVLNSQSQLFDTKAKLAKARYDVLVGGLKLRQAAGTLQAQDLQAIEPLLAAPSTQGQVHLPETPPTPSSTAPTSELDTPAPLMLGFSRTLQGMPSRQELALR
jgi:outer membrane protein